MNEYNIVKLAYLSLRKFGLKVTFGKATNFLRSYYSKTPFEKMMFLKYRYYVAPEDLLDPLRKNSCFQKEIDFTDQSSDINVIVNFESMAYSRIAHTDANPLTTEDFALIAQLASKHGIYGFCFRMNTSTKNNLLDLLRSHPEIDIRYCLSFPNAEAIQRKESSASCWKELSEYFHDPRYIDVSGSPLILLRDPYEFSAPSIWKKQALEHGIENLQVWVYNAARNHNRTGRNTVGADAVVEYSPTGLNGQAGILLKQILKSNGGNHYSYAKVGLYRKALTRVQMIDNRQEDASSCPSYRTCCMGLDPSINPSTKQSKFSEFSDHFFYKWLATDAAYTRWRFPQGARYLFLDAWSENAGQTGLEPNESLGYRYLNTLSKAIFGMPFYDDFKIIGERTASKLQFDDSRSAPRIAVQVHLFFPDLANEIIQQLNQIPFRYDCYVSTDTPEKKNSIVDVFSHRCNAEKVVVECYPNRGRDIAPFLMQMKTVIGQYDYCLHIHGKKSANSLLGSAWRKYLFRNLLGNPSYVRGIIAIFESDPDLGILFPETFPLLKLEPVRSKEKTVCEQILKRCGYCPPQFRAPIYPAGDMFWTRGAAIRRLFQIGLTTSDFPEEKGRPVQTLAHHIERLWVDLAANEGYGYLKVWNACGRNQGVAPKHRIVFFVHFDKDNRIGDSDRDYVRELLFYVDELVFITNSELSSEEIRKVSGQNVQILIRKNVGFDFGAWKDAVTGYGFDRLQAFDQIIFANNSCLAPLWNLSGIFSEMDTRENADIWGITEHPRRYASTKMRKAIIDTHIQSYFFVMEKKIIHSPVFKEYWDHVEYHMRLDDVIEHEETEMITFFTNRGFHYGVFLLESDLLMERTQNTAPYGHPSSLLLLGSPFVKKKSFGYMSPDEEITLKAMMKQIANEN